MRGLVTALLLLAARAGLVLHAVIFPARHRHYRFDLWLLPWIRRRRALSAGPPGREETRDLIFCFVDHFEPGTRGASLEQAQERFRAWTEGYPALARRFADSDGRHPQHSFFFPPHYFREEYLSGLALMDWQGLGEVELHLHHAGDTSESLRSRLEETLSLYAGYGVFQCQGDPIRQRYAFIHGNWALDNSRPEYCGVNDELRVLAATGCFADFTFPSLLAAQPRMVNALYRAVDDPAAPKSYERGRPMTAGRPPGPDEFPLLTGPIGLARRRRFPFFTIEDADVTAENPGTPARVRGWVREAIGVGGRPDWIFVKVHTHGAPERHHDALLGLGAETMYRTLCEEFGDGRHFRLHFASAREMFNIARAAEDGHAGDAGRFRDYEIAPYLTRFLRANVPYEARRFVPAAREGTLPVLDLSLALSQEQTASLEFRSGLLRAASGRIASLQSPSLPMGPVHAAPAAAELRLGGAGGELDLFLLAGCGVNAAGTLLAPEAASSLAGAAVERFHLRLESGQILPLAIQAPAGAPSGAGAGEAPGGRGQA